MQQVDGATAVETSWTATVARGGVFGRHQETLAPVTFRWKLRGSRGPPQTTS